MKRNIISHHFHEVSSTMDEGLLILQNQQFNKNDLVLITADVQHLGRGREGRSWTSLQGNLHLSICFKLYPYDISTLYQLSFVSSLAVNRVLSSLVTSGSVQNKWPNDILIDHQKCAGILIEIHPDFKGIIIGIGVNINTKPVNVIYPTTCLKDHGIQITPVELSLKLGPIINELLTLWEKDGFPLILKNWKHKMWGFNQKITIKTRISTIQGLLYDVDDRGFLLVQQSDGRLHCITAGDVHILNIKENN